MYCCTSVSASLPPFGAGDAFSSETATFNWCRWYLCLEGWLIIQSVQVESLSLEAILHMISANSVFVLEPHFIISVQVVFMPEASASPISAGSACVSRSC